MQLKQIEDSTMIITDSGEWWQWALLIGNVVFILVSLVFYYFLFYIVYKLYKRAKNW